MYSVSLRGLSRVLALLGCGVDVATLWRDLQAVAAGREPDLEAALKETGLDRQQCTVHMQYSAGRHLRRIDDLTYLDRVLLPIRQRWAFPVLPEAEPVLLNLWQAVAQGRVRLKMLVRSLLFHLVECWPDSDMPTSTNRLEGWFGRFKPRARLARGLKTETGTPASCA